MTIVRTVGGDIAPEQLGMTFMHEHLIIDSPLVAQQMPHIHLPSTDDAVTELESCVAAGVGAMVDAMPCAAGRDAARLSEISARSGVHIVAATGLHTDRYYDAHPWARESEPEVLAELFTDDITIGVDRFDNTGAVVERLDARAGIVKIATMGTELTDRDRRLFAAGVETHRRTGAPLITHCEDGTGALEQVELLDALDMPLDGVVLSHTDKVTDTGYHVDILETGVRVEYDQALRQSPDEEKGTAWLVGEMVERGYLDQIMLGTDGARRSLWTTLGGAPGLAWLASGFPGLLARFGVDPSAIEAMFVTNPSEFLAFEPAT